MDRASILASTCSLVISGPLSAAAEHLHAKYPFADLSTSHKSWTPVRMLRVFLKDGFTDRYFGERLVFPGTMRALSVLLPQEFPYHPHWKQSATHPAFWDLSPTVDHIVPIARGGTDADDNVITTSMLRNGSKANWLLEELDWPLERAPIAVDWDGLLGWFMQAWGTHEALRRDPALETWHKAVQRVGAG